MPLIKYLIIVTLATIIIFISSKINIIIFLNNLSTYENYVWVAMLVLIVLPVTIFMCIGTYIENKIDEKLLFAVPIGFVLSTVFEFLGECLKGSQNQLFDD